jgi:flagellar basal-body rod protein FlgB
VNDLFGSVARLERLLDYHLDRHAVLSANVANVETPGYVSKDVTFQDALDEATAGVRRTDPRHLSASPAGAGTPAAMFEDPVGSADHGAALEREMAKVAANSVRYEMAAELVRRRLALLRYAASDGGV